MLPYALTLENHPRRLTSTVTTCMPLHVQTKTFGGEGQHGKIGWRCGIEWSHAAT